MKLSDVITCFTGIEDEPDNSTKPTNKYLLFSKYEKPYVTLVKNLYTLDEGGSAYVAKHSEIINSEIINSEIINSEIINLEYLYYYIRLHMRLLRGKGFKESDQYEFNHMNSEFINNIELPSLPSVDTQNELTPFIRKLYNIEIGILDDDIDELYCEGYYRLDDMVENYKGEYANKLFRIRNRELFFKNIKKGKFQNPVKDYIEIFKPELLDEKYLVYYLHYDAVLEDPGNYHRTSSGFGEFHTGCLHIRLPNIGEQKSIVSFLDNIQEKIKELRAKRRANKLILRKLMDEVEV